MHIAPPANPPKLMKSLAMKRGVDEGDCGPVS
jgi:hypothetical protein